MGKTTSNIAVWVIGVVIVFVFMSYVSSIMNSSGCALPIDQYGACVEPDQP